MWACSGWRDDSASECALRRKRGGGFFSTAGSRAESRDGEWAILRARLADVEKRRTLRCALGRSRVLRISPSLWMMRGREAARIGGPWSTGRQGGAVLVGHRERRRGPSVSGDFPHEGSLVTLYYIVSKGITGPFTIRNALRCSDSRETRLFVKRNWVLSSCRRVGITPQDETVDRFRPR